MNAPLRRRLDLIATGAVCVFYAALEAWRLDFPVVGNDEAGSVMPALSILDNLSGRPLHALPIPLHHWPLMICDYNGCPMSYVLAPIMRIAGVSVDVLRLTEIGISLASVLVLLYLVSKVFPRIPLWAPALCCLGNDMFLLSSRTGLDNVPFLEWLLLPLMLLCLRQWALTRSWRYPLIAFALLGFGIYSKIILVWFLPPTAWNAWSLSRRGDGVRAPLGKLCIVGAVGLLAGSLPLLLFNIGNHWPTASIILEHFRQPGDIGAASNSDFLQNLATRWEHLLYLFNGQPLQGEAFLLSGRVSLALFLIGIFSFKDRAQRRALACVGTYVAAFFVGSTFTFNGRHPYHLLTIFPLMLVVSGISLARLVPYRLPLLILCLLLILPQVRHFNDGLLGCDKALNGTSPRALSSLTDYLLAHGILHPVALDWDIAEPLSVTSGGRIVADMNHYQEPIEKASEAVCFWKSSAPSETLQGCDRLLRDPSVTLGEIRKFPADSAAPVFGLIQVTDVRRRAADEAPRRHPGDKGDL